MPPQPLVNIDKIFKITDAIHQAIEQTCNKEETEYTLVALMQVYRDLIIHQFQQEFCRRCTKSAPSYAQ